MRAEVKQARDRQEVMTSEGCFIMENANDAGDEAVSIARARLEPGVATKWHRLRGISERYIIVSGKGRAEVQNLDPSEVREGDVVRIPPGSLQRITNTGEEDLVFYCVCSPRYRQEQYEEP